MAVRVELFFPINGNIVQLPEIGAGFSLSRLFLESEPCNILFEDGIRPEITDDGTHRIFLLNKKYAATVRAIGRVVAYRGATYFTSQGFKQTAPG